MSKSDMDKLVDKLSVNKVSDEEANKLVDYISELEKMLDETDDHYYFGIQGWKYHIFG